MKILVYGAGVLGSLYTARLQDSGQDVTILARGQRLADVREHGIVLEDATTGQRRTTRVNVVGGLVPNDAYDLALVLVRKNQVSSVLSALAANRGTPSVLFMVNNAAGPEEMVAALGRERVLLGFAGAGGTREGYIVRTTILSGREQPTCLGELDGHVTPRVKEIAQAFKDAGFPTVIRKNMDAWLKTHVAVVSPIANAIYMAEGNIYRLARDREDVRLMLRAMREGFKVLRALNVPITPANLRILELVPEPLMVMYLQRLLNTERAELTIARHANAARDEMKQIADEFTALARSTSVPTSAIDRLHNKAGEFYRPTTFVVGYNPQNVE